MLHSHLLGMLCKAKCSAASIALVSFEEYIAPFRPMICVAKPENISWAVDCGVGQPEYSCVVCQYALKICHHELTLRIVECPVGECLHCLEVLYLNCNVCWRR